MSVERLLLGGALLALQLLQDLVRRAVTQLLHRAHVVLQLVLQDAVLPGGTRQTRTHGAAIAPIGLLKRQSWAIYVDVSRKKKKKNLL